LIDIRALVLSTESKIAVVALQALVLFVFLMLATKRIAERLFRFVGASQPGCRVGVSGRLEDRTTLDD
jgi:hypothetical protein